MKCFSKILFLAYLTLVLSACNEVLVPEQPETGEVPVRLSFSMADRDIQTKSKVSGTETVVTVMQMVCFDANGQYLGIRNAEIKSHSTSDLLYDQGVLSGTVPQGTARIHFIANRSLDVPLSHSNGTAESVVMNSVELSTLWSDSEHQKVCYWGYHKEDNATAMSTWLKPEEGSNHVVYMIRDRARVILTYDSEDAEYPVTKIEWLIHNGRARGYLAPAESFWTNDGYYEHSTSPDHTSEWISKAEKHECTIGNRYSLWTSAELNDDDKFDTAYPYPSGSDYGTPQFLFDDDNADSDDVKVILKVTYTVSGTQTTVYHTLRLNDDDKVRYDIVRNNTYYIKCSKLSPYVAFYTSLEDAINGNEFVNADVEVDRTVPDIDNNTYTLQIKLPNEGTSIVLNTEGVHSDEMFFVYRLASNVNTEASTEPDDFNVYWEKSQTFCSNPTVTYNSTTKQFAISTTVLTGKLTDQLQDEWIVVEHKTSKLKRYIHVYVIDEFRYKLYPTLKAVSGTTDEYVLSFQIPPMEHTQFLADGSPDPEELVYPETLYPIDIKFTTNTLNAYGTTQGTTNYGLFGVSVENTDILCDSDNFEVRDTPPYFHTPISSTLTSNKTHWYFQQANNYWDFWYTYSLKTYPTNGIVNIYFKDVRSHIKYAAVADVGLFLYVEYFGKNYSVSVSTN